MKHQTISTTGLDTRTAMAVEKAFDTLNRAIKNLSDMAYVPKGSCAIANHHVDSVDEIDQFLSESYKILWQYVDRIDPCMKENYRQARQTAAQCYADCSRIITEALTQNLDLDRSTLLNEITINRPSKEAIR